MKEVNEKEYFEFFEKLRLRNPEIKSFTDVDGTCPFGYGRPAIVSTYCLGEYELCEVNLRREDRHQETWDVTHFIDKELFEILEGLEFLIQELKLMKQRLQTTAKELNNDSNTVKRVEFQLTESVQLVLLEFFKNKSSTLKLSTESIPEVGDYDLEVKATDLSNDVTFIEFSGSIQLEVTKGMITNGVDEFGNNVKNLFHGYSVLDLIKLW